MGIRRESVELSLNDTNFTTGLAKAAAATALLNHELGNLDGTSVGASKSTDGLGRSTKTTGDETEKATRKTREYTLEMAKADEVASRHRKSLQAEAKALVDQEQGLNRSSQAFRKSTSDIDKYSGRLSVMIRGIAAVGPALIPISAAAIPAITGLAAGFGAAAGAAGVAALAFSGVGDAIKAIDAARLEPTAENLQKMQQALDDLGPAGANFAQFIDGLEPQLKALQESARDGLFPGLQDGIEALLPMLPQVQTLISSISTEMGKLASDAGKGIANDQGFQDFFRYLQTDAAPTLEAFGKATGKIASGLASLTVAFAPLNRDFASGLDHAADSFQRWAAGLNQTQGFQDFLSYIETEGPQVVELLESLATAGLGIFKAFTPIGTATLPILTALAKVLGLIANSPLGPIVAAVISINSAVGLASLAVDKLAASWARVAAAAGAATAAETDAAAAAAGGAAAGGAGLAGAVAAPVAIGTGLAYLGAKSADQKVATRDSEVYTNLQKLLAGGAMAGGTLTQAAKTDPTESHLLGLYATGRTGKQNTQLATADTTLSSAVIAGGQSAADAEKYIKSLGLTTEQTASAFPKYTSAVKEADAATKGAATSTDSETSAQQKLRAAATGATGSLRDQIAAQKALHQQALENFDAVTSFGQAVQAAAKQAKDGATKGLNPFTEAGAANRSVLSQMIQTWNAQPAAIKNNIGQYNAMKSKLVEFATQMGATKAQIADLTRVIDKPKKLVVSAETSAAVSALQRIINMAAGIHDKTVRLNYIVTQSAGASVRAAGGRDGDPATPYASGGYTGLGGKYEPAGIVHRREFVFSSEATDGNEAMLDSLHRQLRGYAGGGLVGGDFSYNASSTTVSSSSSSSSSSSKAKDKETKAEEKAAKEHEKTAAAAKKLKDALNDLHKSVDPKQAKSAGSLLKSLNKAKVTGYNLDGSVDRAGTRWDGWTKSEVNTIKKAEQASVALNKMKLSTEKQVKAYDRAADKAATREKAALDVAKAHKQAVVDDIASIKQAIAARYQSDVFGNVDSSSLAYQIDPKTGKYVTAQQSATLQTQGVIAGLQKDIADAQAAKTAEASIAAALKKQGLSKDTIDAATEYMAENASVSQMQALASSPALATQYAQLYAQRQSVSNATGQAMANQVDAQALAAATKTVDLLTKQSAAADARAKKADKIAQKYSQDLNDLRAYVKNHLAKDVGKETGTEINTASKKGK